MSKPSEVLRSMLRNAEAAVKDREALWHNAIAQRDEAEERVRKTSNALSQARARVSDIMDQIDAEKVDS